MGLNFRFEGSLSVFDECQESVTGFESEPQSEVKTRLQMLLQPLPQPFTKDKNGQLEVHARSPLDTALQVEVPMFVMSLDELITTHSEDTTETSLSLLNLDSHHMAQDQGLRLNKLHTESVPHFFSFHIQSYPLIESNECKAYPFDPRSAS